MTSEVFVTLVDTSKWMTFSDELIDADGKVWKASWSGPADGTMHPMTGNSSEQLGDNAVKDVEVISSPNGSIQTCRFFLSAEKVKFSEKCITVTKSGKKSTQFLVYDRIK